MLYKCDLRASVNRRGYVCTHSARVCVCRRRVQRHACFVKLEQLVICKFVTWVSVRACGNEQREARPWNMKAHAL